MKPASRQMTEGEIDSLVESQADDDSAWGKAVEVRRRGPAAFSIPAQFLSRAAFLAKLHRERKVEDWIAKMIKERVELEEIAFNEAKREMSMRTGH